MPMIKAITSGFERALEVHRNERRRLEEERLSELQYARQMRNRAEPGSTDYYYYNAIVKTNGGW